MLVDWLLGNAVFGVAKWVSGIDMPATAWLMLWAIVNVAFIPVILRMIRDKEDLRAIQLDRVVYSSLITVGLHALFFLSIITLAGIKCVPVHFYLVFYAILAPVFTLWVMLSRRLIKAYRRRGYNYVRVVIVGTNTTSRRLFDQMLADSGYGYKVMAFFDKEWHPDFAGRYCGMLDNLDEYVKANNIDQIYYTMPGGDAAILTRVVKIADDNVAEFFYVPQISQYITRGFQLDNIGAVPVLSIRRNPLKKGVNRAIKRAFDLAVSSVFLCFYPLIYIPVAIAIKISSPGPVYFKQLRTGYKGRPFLCYKFRTMRVNVNADQAQATKDDPRKTRLGDFLRRTSLDELPQFINVWKGDMSIVGPRPHMLKHTEDYSKIVSQYMVRHLIKPGITGWAQVNGFRGPTDELWKMERRVQCDVWYVENWTFLFDLKIIVRTVINAVHGEDNAF